MSELTTASTHRVLTLGEALIDAVDQSGTVTEHVGGSLLNVGAGLSQLGHDTTVVAWYGRDDHGTALEEWAAKYGTGFHEGSDGAEQTSVAHASLDEQGRASYTFDLTWDVPELDDLDDYQHLHTGSIAATLEPGGSKVVEAVKAISNHGTVSYDPNVRPAIMHSPDQVIDRIEEVIALSHLVKASDEDVEWLYPGVPVQRIMRRWLKLGPAMVVITRGPWGAWAALAGDTDMLAVDQMNVTVGDTVGAGDSFMAGLLSGLLDNGMLGDRSAIERLRSAKWADVQPAMHRAVATSAITVSNRGAYPPDRGEVEAILESPPPFDGE